MSSIINELRDLIRPEFICSDDSGTTIILKEANEQATCPDITIRKGSTKTLTIQSDLQGQDLHPIFRNDIAILNKTPDYIVFCENQIIAPKKTYVFVIELKSGNPSGWQRQARGGLAIAKYIVGTLENYQTKRYTNIEYRSILFSSRSNYGMRKKKRLANKAFRYSLHEIFGYYYTERHCNVSKPYELDLFLR